MDRPMQAVGGEYTGLAGGRGRIAWAVATLAFLLSGLSMVSTPAPASAAFRFVSASGGSDAGNDCLDQDSRCATIQHAIDEADAFDTILVPAGTYTENLTIDKRLILMGPNWQRGIVNRDAEATIHGGGGVAITPQAKHIEIGGFTLASDQTGYPVRTSGADVDELTISDSVLRGGVAAIRLDAGGEEISLERNVIEGDGYGIFLGDSGFPDLAIENNRIPASSDFSGIFAGASTTIPRLELNGNEIEAPSYIGGAVTDGRVGWNVFDLNSPGDIALQIRMQGWILIENTFVGHRVASCLQLLGSQGGLDPSRETIVSGSDFRNCTPHGIQLGPDVEGVNVTGNTFPGSYEGVSTSNVTPWDVTGNDIRIFGNRMVGTTVGVANSVTGVLDARNNWWGCNGGPGAAGCNGVSFGVDTSPHVVLSGEVWEDVEGWDAPLNAIDPGGQAVIVARLDRNSAGAIAFGVPTDGTTVVFSASNGSIWPPSTFWQNGHAMTGFTAGMQPGSAGIVVTMDNQQIGVPLTITGALPPIAPPPPTAPARITRPRIQAHRGSVMPLRRKPTVGTIACGSSACRVERKSATVKLDGKTYRVNVKLLAAIEAEAFTPIQVVLPREVSRQLSKGKSGRVKVTVALTDASGYAITETFVTKIKRRKT
jgi:hypothetical protein